MFIYTILIILHIIISICLMIVVLVQSGKGGGLSGAFGGAGATQTMFGGRGAGDFLTRTTQVLGGAFMLTSIVLVLLGGSGNRTGLSSESQRIIQEIQDAAAQSAAPVGAGDLPPLQEGFGTQGAPELPAGERPAPAGDAPATGGETAPATGGESAPAETSAPESGGDGNGS